MHFLILNFIAVLVGLIGIFGAYARERDSGTKNRNYLHKRFISFIILTLIMALSTPLMFVGHGVGTFLSDVLGLIFKLYSFIVLALVISCWKKESAK